MKERILQLIEDAEDGLTSKDLAILLCCPRSTVCRRLAEMKSEGLIEGTGEYRADAAIVAAVQQRALALTGEVPNLLSQ